MKTMARLLPLVLALQLTGCGTAAGRRMGQDAFVVGTSPIQIPVMAARDAARNFDDPATSAVLFPITFPLYTLEHTVLTLAHAGDLLIFPSHFLSERESLRIYRGIELPLRRGANAQMFEDGLGTTLVFAAAVAAPVLWFLVTSSL